MKLTKSCFVFLILGVLVLTGCYGSPAFEGDVTVGKEGQTDVGSEEPCVGDVGTAVLTWVDTQEQVPTLDNYILHYGVESQNYSNILELPPTGGVPFSKQVDEDNDGQFETKEFQEFMYEMNNLERGYTYYFMLKAENEKGKSPPSNEVFKKFEICPLGINSEEVNFNQRGIRL